MRIKIRDLREGKSIGESMFNNVPSDKDKNQEIQTLKIEIHTAMSSTHPPKTKTGMMSGASEVPTSCIMF